MAQEPKVLTSTNNALQTPAIPLPPGIPGHLNITFAPGKKGPAYDGRVLRDRDLDQDLRRLRELGTTVLAGFTDAEEMDGLQVPLPEVQRQAKALGLTYRHHAIPDVSAPKGEEGQRAALTFAYGLAQDLQRGETVTVYCRGGLGRSRDDGRCRADDAGPGG